MYAYIYVYTYIICPQPRHALLPPICAFQDFQVGRGGLGSGGTTGLTLLV